jgi:alkane 1-monooxygenase
MPSFVPYGLVFVPVALAAAGLAWGGPWTWATVAFVFGLVPLADLVLGRNLRNPEPAEVETPLARAGFRAVSWAVVPALLGLGVAAAAAVATRPFAIWELVGVLLSVGTIAGGIGITAAHELIHKTNRFERALGQALLLNACYMHFYIEHLVGHHSRVSTPEDPASARLGESFYAFWPRTVVGSFRSAWGIEAQRLGRAGAAAWGPRNRMLWYVAAPLAAAGALAAAFGPVAGAFFLAQGVVAFSLLEVVNYLEHYGLERRALPGGRFERVAEHHSWSCANRLTNWFLFQLQRHADHHMHATRRYEALRHLDGAPELPTGYAGMIWLALVPPLWRRVMDPRVAAVRRAALAEE